MDITQDVQSLLEKLDGLELTEGERAVFGRLLGLEDDEEVEGFSFDKIAFEFAPTVQGFNTGKKLDQRLTSRLQEDTVPKHR